MRMKVLCAVLLIGGFLASCTPSVQEGGTSDQVGTSEVTMHGVIREFGASCFIPDGDCAIKVDDQWVLAFVGGPPPPSNAPIYGKVIGFTRSYSSQEMAKFIGKEVDVYGKKTKEGVTLIGSTQYYVKIVNP